MKIRPKSINKKFQLTLDCVGWLVLSHIPNFYRIVSWATYQLKITILEHDKKDLFKNLKGEKEISFTTSKWDERVVIGWEDEWNSDDQI